MVPGVFQGLIKADPGIPEIMRELVSKISMKRLVSLQMAKQKVHVFLPKLYIVVLNT